MYLNIRSSGGRLVSYSPVLDGIYVGHPKFTSKL